MLGLLDRSCQPFLLGIRWHRAGVRYVRLPLQRCDVWLDSRSDKLGVVLGPIFIVGVSMDYFLGVPVLGEHEQVLEQPR